MSLLQVQLLGSGTPLGSSGCLTEKAALAVNVIGQRDLVMSGTRGRFKNPSPLLGDLVTPRQDPHLLCDLPPPWPRPCSLAPGGRLVEAELSREDGLSRAKG